MYNNKITHKENKNASETRSKKPNDPSTEIGISMSAYAYLQMHTKVHYNCTSIHTGTHITHTLIHSRAHTHTHTRTWRYMSQTFDKFSERLLTF